MILYHFTAGQYLRAIARHGLTVGDVPTDISRNKGKVGVWLTSSPLSHGHGLVGSILDKQRFRLSINIQDNDLNLVRWLEWAPSNVTPDTLNALHQDNGSNFETWYIYFGHIATDSIVDVIDMSSDTSVSIWENHWPEETSLKGYAYRDRFLWKKRVLRRAARVIRRATLRR